MDKFYFIDPVHGKVEYPGYIKKCIATEEFQRLRHLKQLGVSSRVFYSATHTRFEHCLGVCFLSLKLMKTLEKNSGVLISNIHKKCVAIAGLFHDLGHGPYSHLWESFVNRNSSEDWAHEQTSCSLVRHIFDKYDIKLSEESHENMYGVELIQALISGDLSRLSTLLSPDLMYLSEIVANKYSNIDVDKHDYILRDEYYLRGNVRILEFKSLFDNCRILEDINGIAHISYDIKDFDLISNLFENRANLHIYCYQEPNVRGIEHMIIDALALAEEAGFTIKGEAPSLLHNYPEKYKFLTDTITSLVSTSEDPNLLEAQKILQRLNSGDFYKLVWMSPTPFNMNALTEKFGPHFFEVQKRIPLASAFMMNNIVFHDQDGNRVTPPVEKLPKRGAYYEEYLIFTKSESSEQLDAVSEFIFNMRD